MKRNGFTLLEVLMVVCVISILLALAIPNFGSWSRKYNTDSQINGLYTDLAAARIDAMHIKLSRNVLLTATQYTISDVNGVLKQTKLKLPIVWSGNSNNLIFDTRGFVNTVTAQGILTELTPAYTVCMPSTDDPPHDCLVISSVKTNLGKLIAPGGPCDIANCQIK